MIMKTAISNKAHPEYGQATIPFPIPDSEYDHTIGLLEGMGIGSPTAQDCRVDFAPQPVITKDNVPMQIDTVIYFQIIDPKLYTYGVEHPMSAIENLPATTPAQHHR